MSIATNTTNNVTSTESASDPSNPSLRSVFQPKQSTSSPSSVAQANWEFVKQLLQVSIDFAWWFGCRTFVTFLICSNI